MRRRRPSLVDLIKIAVAILPFLTAHVFTPACPVAEPPSVPRIQQAAIPL